MKPALLTGAFLADYRSVSLSPKSELGRESLVRAQATAVCPVAFDEVPSRHDQRGELVDFLFGHMRLLKSMLRLSPRSST